MFNQELAVIVILLVANLFSEVSQHSVFGLLRCFSYSMLVVSIVGASRVHVDVQWQPSDPGRDPSPPSRPGPEAPSLPLADSVPIQAYVAMKQ